MMLATATKDGGLTAIHAGDVLQYQSPKRTGWADAGPINSAAQADQAIRAVRNSRAESWSYRIVSACRRFVVLDAGH